MSNCFWPSVLVCLCALSVHAAASGDPPSFEDGKVVGTVANPQINEASGLAASRQTPGVLWVHNDSGDSPRVFAMDTSGAHLAQYTLSGASHVDWEDMAIGPGPVPGRQYLYLGDIGDNGAQRGSITVYRVPEPIVMLGQSPVTGTISEVETITLQYPDSARDAETLLVDPANGDIYVVSKREAKSRVYRAAYPQASNVVMDHVASLPWGGATAGEISPDGDEIIIRGYSDASLWQREAGQSIADALGGSPIDVPVIGLFIEPQGEAIAFDATGTNYYTVSERSNQPIYEFIRVPEPGTAALLAIGAGLLLRRRRR